MLRKLSATILILLMTTACAKRAVIITDPPGARVSINGEEVCTTPCAYQYSTSAGSDYDLVVRKDGYEQLEYVLQADEVDGDARGGLLAAGLVIPGGSALWVGALFTNKLKESYRFVLKEAEPEQVAMQQAAGL